MYSRGNGDDWEGMGKWILFFIACSIFAVGYLLYRVAVYLFTHIQFTFFLPLLLVCCNSPNNTEAPTYTRACAEVDTVIIYTSIPKGCSMYCPDPIPEMPVIR